MNDNLAIVGMTCRCSVGLTAESAAAAVRAGIGRIAEHPYIVDDVGDPLRASLEPTLPADISGTERMERLARLALEPLMDNRALFADEPRPIPVLLALPEHRPGFSATDEARVTASIGDFDRRLAVRGMAKGHAAGLDGLAQCEALLRTGDHRFVILGGVDSYLHPDTLEWLIANRQIQAGSTRAGFFPGEAAGFLVVATEQSLRSGSARPFLATLRGCCSAVEHATLRSDDVNQAKALTAAIRGACATFGPDELCDRIICDLNGERYRTDEWSTTLLRIPTLLRHEHGRPATYDSPAASWGDVGAASGPLFCILAVAAWQRRYARGGTTLLFAGSEHGLRTAAVLQHPWPLV